jgi:nitroreductase
MGGFNEEKLRTILEDKNLISKEKYQIAVLMSIGYPEKETKKVISPKKRSLKKKLSKEMITYVQ